MEEDGRLFTLPKLQLPKLDVVRDSENDFMKSAVEAANSVIKYSRLAAALQPTVDINPDEHKILVGHMVRLSKLYDTMVLLIVKNRMEMVFILNRAFTETIINFEYFLDNINKELCDKFFRASLAYERKLYDEILSRKQKEFLPIENRMIKSIIKTFERSGYNIEDIEWKDRHWAGTLFDRAKKTNLIDMYEFSYRGASHNIHGTWHDLDFYHLTTEKEVWHPELRYSKSRPQMIDPASLFILNVTKDYINKITHRPYNEALLENIDKLIIWFTEIMELHENWLHENKSDQNLPEEPPGM